MAISIIIKDRYFEIFPSTTCITHDILFYISKWNKNRETNRIFPILSLEWMNHLAIFYSEIRQKKESLSFYLRVYMISTCYT